MDFKLKLNNIYFKLFIAAFFWGGAAIAAKILLNSASPCIATCTRFVGASVILLFIVRLPMGKVHISLREHLSMFLLGLVGITLCYYLYFTGLNLSSPFNAALFEATTPLLTFLISLILRKENYDKFQFIGLWIAYLGVIIITSQGSIGRLIHMEFNIGDLLLLASTVCFGLYNILCRQFEIKISGVLKTYYIFLYGSICLIPWFIYDISVNNGIQLNVSATSLISILFLALGSSVISYMFFNEGIAQLGASKASECINLVPVITIILSLLVFRDFPKGYQVLGAFVILLGMRVSKRSEKIKDSIEIKEQNSEI